MFLTTRELDGSRVRNQAIDSPYPLARRGLWRASPRCSARFTNETRRPSGEKPRKTRKQALHPGLGTAPKSAKSRHLGVSFLVLRIDGIRTCYNKVAKKPAIVSHKPFNALD